LSLGKIDKIGVPVRPALPAWTGNNLAENCKRCAKRLARRAVASEIDAASATPAVIFAAPVANNSAGRRSLASGAELVPYRQVADPLTGRRKDGIGERGCKWRHGRFAEPGRLRGTLHD